MALTAEQRKLKSVAENVFRASLKGYEGGAFEGELGHYIDSTFRRFMKDNYKDRHVTALINLFGEISSKYDKLLKKGDAVSAFETLMMLETFPIYNYNLLDSYGSLRLGAAIWMLDALREENKIDKVISDFVPPLFSMAHQRCPFRVMHPEYSPELIEMMSLTLTLRYIKDNEKANKIALRNCIIPEPLIRGRKIREQYARVLAAIPQEKIDKACDMFRDKMWKCLDLSLRTYNWKADALVDDRKKSVGKTEPVSKMTSVNVFSKPVVDIEFEPKQIKDKVVENMHFSFKDMCHQKEENSSFAMRCFLENLDDMSAVFAMDKEKLESIGITGELQKEILEFDIEDPYALCFALIYLLDKDDDLPWMFHAGGILMAFVEQCLPWAEKKEEGCWQPIVFPYGFNTVGKEQEESKKRVDHLVIDKPEKEEVQDDSETDVLIFEDSKPEGGSLCKTQPGIPTRTIDYQERVNGITLAQALYRTCNVAAPHRKSDCADTIDELTGHTLPERDVRFMASLADAFAFRAMGCKITFEDTNLLDDDVLEEGKDASEEDVCQIDSTEKGEETQTDSVDLAAEVERLRKELADKEADNCNLQKTLTTMCSRFDKLTMEQGKMFEDSLREHKELIDLRELMFNNQEGNTNEEETLSDEETSLFPYTVKKRTVVFGGHETFLTQMKKNVLNVKFVSERNVSFSPEIVKNADVIWIQSNCLSHSQFGNIMRHAGTYNKQVRYFTQGGWVRCAQQMVEEDKL